MERGEINERLNNLSPEAQEVIATTSSFFLEEDVHQDYLRDPNKIEALKEQLREQGLDDEGVKLALEVCGFKGDNGGSDEQ